MYTKRELIVLSRIVLDGGGCLLYGFRGKRAHTLTIIASANNTQYVGSLSI